MKNISDLLKASGDLITDFVNNNPEFIDKENAIKNLKASLLDKFDGKGVIDDKILNTLDTILNKAVNVERNKQATNVLKLGKNIATAESLYELTKKADDKPWNELTSEEKAYKEKTFLDSKSTLENKREQISDIREKLEYNQNLLRKLKESGEVYDNIDSLVKSQSQILEKLLA